MMKRVAPVAAVLVLGVASCRHAESGVVPPHSKKTPAGLLARREAQLRASAKVAPEFWPWLAAHPDIRAGLLLSGDPSQPLRAENLDALRQAVTPAQANVYAHLLLAAALRAAPVGAPAPSSERAGSMADTDRPGAYPPRIAPSVCEQIRAQIKRLEAQVPSLRSRAPSASSGDGLGPACQPPELALRARERKGPAGQPSGHDLVWPLFPVKSAPYYLLHPLTCEVSLREQDFIWERFVHPQAGQSRVLTYASATYGWEYTKPDIRNKKSDWEPDSIPRILEDGGVCGRLARMEATGKSVLGVPAATCGQPGHCALMALGWREGAGYSAEIRQSESGDWSNTRPHQPLGLSPAMAGFEHEAVAWLALAKTANRVKFGDYAEALALAQLAEEAVDGKAALLRRAVAANPYHLAAWEALAQAEGATPEAFNRVFADLAHALVPEGADKAVRADGTRIARVLVARQVAKAYAGFLAKENDQAQVLAAFTALIERLDDDNLLGTGADLWPLYLRHLAKTEPERALEAAEANLERALLGRRDGPKVLDEAASPLCVAVRGLEAACSALPPVKRAQVFADACAKIETIHGDGEKVAYPELVGGKTVWPEKAMTHPALERARTLRDAGGKSTLFSRPL